MPQLQEISKNLWALNAETVDYAVRAVIVIGEKKAVVWDSLTQPADMAALAELLGEKPFHLIYSHGDWDHVWGTAGLARPPLTICAHAECRWRFANDVPRTLRQQQLAEPGKWDSVQLIPPNLSFSSRLTFDLGGLTLELHHLPGHTSDSIVGWLPEWGIFLGGDAIETPLPVVNSARLLPGWLRALEGWAERAELKQALPAHGSLLGRDSLDQTVAYLRALLGDKNFDLPPQLDDFYRETQQSNLKVVAEGLELHA